MKIDSAIKEFTEKYDQEMLGSIDALSRELGYEVKGYTMEAFNLSEATSNFVTFMEGYVDYMGKHVNDEQQLSEEEIMESTKKYIAEGCIKPAQIKYPELPNFVKSYVECIKTLDATTNKVKRALNEYCVEQSYIGYVNDMVDEFTEAVQSRFYPIMEKMLWASGYNARQRLAAAGKNPTDNRKDPTPIFI